MHEIRLLLQFVKLINRVGLFKYSFVVHAQQFIFEQQRRIYRYLLAILETQKKSQHDIDNTTVLL